MKKLYRVNQITWKRADLCKCNHYSIVRQVATEDMRCAECKQPFVPLKNKEQYFGYRWAAEMFCDDNNLSHDLIEKVNPYNPSGISWNTSIRDILNLPSVE